MKQNKTLYVVLRAIVRPFLKILYRYKIYNANNIPKEGGYILACNHISCTDPILLGLGQKRTVSFMAKAELFKNKFLGWLISLIGAFPVDRGSGDGEAINTGEELLNKGEVMGIFIEGTRSKTGDFLRPRSGCALIAQQTGLPVIPASITATKKGKTFSKRVVRFGEPITTEELGLTSGDRRELRVATKKIMDEIRKLREMDFNDY